MSYIVTGGMLILLAILAFVILPNVFTTISHNTLVVVVGVVYGIVALLSLTFTFIANKIYWGNSWVITSDSVTQYSQTSLFNKRSSQLSLDNIENVSSAQDGPISHVFNYGTLRVVTAGDKSQFVFRFCPRPNFYAQRILDAREKFVQMKSLTQPPPPVIDSTPPQPPSYQLPAQPASVPTEKPYQPTPNTVPLPPFPPIPVPADTTGTGYSVPGRTKLER